MLKNSMIENDIRGICPIPGLYMATSNGRELIKQSTEREKDTYYSEEAYREDKASVAYKVQAYMHLAGQEAPCRASYAGEDVSLKTAALTNTSTYRRLVSVRRISVYIPTSSRGLSCRIFFIRWGRNRGVDGSHYMRRWLLCRWVRDRRIRLHVSLAVVWPQGRFWKIL